MAKETVEILCQKAQQAMTEGANDAARQFYLQALGVKADSPDVHYGLATICFLLGDLASAAYHFKEVTRLDPLRAGAHINLGAVYNRMDMLEEAIQVLRRGIQLDRNRAEGYYNLGVVYRRTAQPDLAVQAYREAVRLNPRMADAHYNIGNIYLEREQHGLALAHYKQALALRPSWDKPQHGLEQCEGVLNHPPVKPAEAETGPNPPVAVSVQGGPEGDKAFRLDPRKHINPDVHGTLLTSLHKATVESDVHSRSFLKIVEREIEPAIKELSSYLLYPNSSLHDLERCLHKFETAVANMRDAQHNLQSCMKTMQQIGDQLVRT